MEPEDDRPWRLSLPLALTLGGMITLGIITTTAGLLLWPDPPPDVVGDEGELPLLRQQGIGVQPAPMPAAPPGGTDTKNPAGQDQAAEEDTASAHDAGP